MGEMFWKETQRVLQADDQPLISKPKLTDALLQRPPFRFFFDIVTEVQVVTGFAKDLFAGQSLDPKAMDKDAKLRYLQQLIAAVHAATGVPVTMNPAKMVAGLEPEATNAFLQLLARAAKGAAATPVVPVKETAPPHPTNTDHTAPPPTQQEVPPANPPPPLPVPTPSITPPNNPARPTTARRAPPRAAFQRATSIVRPGTASGVRAMAARVLEQATTDALDTDDDIQSLPAPLISHAPLTNSNNTNTAAPALGALTKDLLEAQQRYQAAGALGEAPGGGQGGPGVTPHGGLLADAVQGLSQLVAQAGRCLDRLPEDVEAMAKEYAAWVAAGAKDAARLEEEQRSMESASEGAAELARVEALVRHAAERVETLQQAVDAGDVQVYRALMRVAGGPKARDMPMAVPW